MHSLETIQAMNKAAIEDQQKEENKVTFEKLDEMLFEWEAYDGDDVPGFIQEWVEKLGGEPE